MSCVSYRIILMIISCQIRNQVTPFSSLENHNIRYYVQRHKHNSIEYVVLGKKDLSSLCFFAHTNHVVVESIVFSFISFDFSIASSAAAPLPSPSSCLHDNDRMNFIFITRFPTW